MPKKIFSVCSIHLTKQHPNVYFTKPLSIFSSLPRCVLTECSQLLPQRASAPRSGPDEPRPGTLLMRDDMEMFLPLAQQPAGGSERVATRQSFEATCPTQPHAQPQLHPAVTVCHDCSVSFIYLNDFSVLLFIFPTLPPSFSLQPFPSFIPFRSFL